MFEEITPDSVLVSKNTGDLVGHFGELTGNSAMERGCVGVVLDGNLRDTAGVREIGLQVFYRDVNPLTGIGRWEMIAHQSPSPSATSPCTPATSSKGEQPVQMLLTPTAMSL